MIAIHRPLAVVAALFTLSGCASAADSLDRMADRIDSRSNCHTSNGEWVGGPTCTISYSVSSTKTTTTTVTTTTETTPAQPTTDD